MLLHVACALATLGVIPRALACLNTGYSVSYTSQCKSPESGCGNHGFRNRTPSYSPVPHSFNLRTPKEHPSTGSSKKWIVWKILKRLRVGVGRTKANMEKWGFLPLGTSADCVCGQRQTTAHLLQCSLHPATCSQEDLALATPRVTEVAKHFIATDNVQSWADAWTNTPPTGYSSWLKFQQEYNVERWKTKQMLGRSPSYLSDVWAPVTEPVPDGEPPKLIELGWEQADGVPPSFAGVANWTDKIAQYLNELKAKSAANVVDPKQFGHWPVDWSDLEPGNIGVGPPPTAYIPENTAKASFCFLTPIVGNCGIASIRWAYNPYRGKCGNFTYQGCGANGNNFETEEACEEACRCGTVTGCVARPQPPTFMTYAMSNSRMDD